ncbi:patatin-like phospholipase family protein [Nocardioides sp. TRM66260-LWL]|uniref:patatin-like phospholipase family protein n=1 Tax=Nocardioides sp. TRM66260-LWL TaxID=2874478 RepID=UPI001CC42C64|nr:patatin-like phospholipase family protein [Nocardioides sp. TRM66260-LWL]MBZ5736121.1 patatin-like phospholipase family protein [Nocardioides sp. TRM66260-LWL]
MEPRCGIAVGCGGLLGYAWSAVVLDELERALGWDARSATVLLGTSAGAEVVAALGSGRRPAQLVAALEGAGEGQPSGGEADVVLARHAAHAVPGLPRPPRLLDPPGLLGRGAPAPGVVRAGLRERTAYTALAGLLPRGRGDASWLRRHGDDLAGGEAWFSHPATWLVATDAATGARVALGAPDAPAATPGEALAASWAIPGWYPPVRVAGRHLVDGGTSSSVSADLLAPLGLDELVVIAPMTSAGGAPARGAARLERLLRVPMTRRLDAEVAVLEAAGTRVVRLEPSAADLAAMGASFMDVRRRPATVAAARRSAPGLVAAALVRAGVPTDHRPASPAVHRPARP